ncbi:MAG: hypothetical protein LBJ88_00195 [Campylobacteraceae bacterium]|nr:hypothetical protein [Campylobacteraceae bacterium]
MQRRKEKSLMMWEPLIIVLVIAGSGWSWVSKLVRRRRPSDPSMFDYASWPQAAYTAARWGGIVCFLAFGVVIAYGLLGMAFGWFEGYGDDWWILALRVSMAMCLVCGLGTVLDFLTDGRPFMARTQNWYSLNSARKRRFFFTYAIGITMLMIAANMLMWLA